MSRLSFDQAAAVVSASAFMIAFTGCEKQVARLQSGVPHSSFKDRDVYILDDGTRYKDSSLLAIQFQLNEDLVENWTYLNDDSMFTVVNEDSFDITLTNIGFKSGSDYYLTSAGQEAIIVLPNFMTSDMINIGPQNWKNDIKKESPKVQLGV